MRAWSLRAAEAARNDKPWRLVMDTENIDDPFARAGHRRQDHCRWAAVRGRIATRRTLRLIPRSERGWRRPCRAGEREYALPAARCDVASPGRRQLFVGGDLVEGEVPACPCPLARPCTSRRASRARFRGGGGGARRGRGGLCWRRVSKVAGFVDAGVFVEDPASVAAPEGLGHASRRSIRRVGCRRRMGPKL